MHGGTHLAAFKESFVRTIRDFFKKDFDVSDIRASIVTALSVRLQNPVFESQTKNKLGFDMGPDGCPTIKIFKNNFLKQNLIIFYIKSQVVELILKKYYNLKKKEKILQV